MREWFEQQQKSQAFSETFNNMYGSGQQTQHPHKLHKLLAVGGDQYHTLTNMYGGSNGKTGS
jgi:hypothetical protein